MGRGGGFGGMPPPGYGPPPGWTESSAAVSKGGVKGEGQAAEEEDDDGAPPGIDDGPPGTEASKPQRMAAPVTPGTEQVGGGLDPVAAQEEEDERKGWAEALEAGGKVWFCASSGAAALEVELVRVVRAGEGGEGQGDAATGEEGGGGAGGRGAVEHLTVRDGGLEFTRPLERFSSQKPANASLPGGPPAWLAGARCWDTHRAPDGAEYFANTDTGETTWTRPAALEAALREKTGMRPIAGTPWMEVSSGAWAPLHFFNSYSGTATWKEPLEVAHARAEAMRRAPPPVEPIVAARYGVCVRGCTRALFVSLSLSIPAPPSLSPSLHLTRPLSLPPSLS